MSEARAKYGNGGTIELHIPTLPDMELATNARRTQHWSTQHRNTKVERLNAGLFLRLAAGTSVIQSLPTPWALHWTLYFPKGMRARDADNCVSALKSYQDAMVDSGWIANDSPRYVRTVSVTVIPTSPLGPSMKLVIESATEGQ